MSRRYSALFPEPRALIGVVHLAPLPGSPGASMAMDEVCRRAAADARALASAGFDALIVENFGDAPFFPGAVPPVTVAAMTVAAQAVAEAAAAAPRPPALGINVLRNDAQAALAIAVATGAAFVRINVHTGAMLTDQGLVTGQAHDTLRARRALGREDLALLCDVMVKHAVPIGPQQLEDVARDTWHRGGADALIVSGAGTGLPTDPGRLAQVRDAAPDAPLLVGSGADLSTLAGLFSVADGVIVGTALKVGGVVTQPVDPARAAAFVEARERIP